jgi:hypothetical protein
MFVTLKVIKLIGPSNDGRRHGRGTYLLLKKSEEKRRHFGSQRGNTKQATVFQSEVIAVKAVAEALISNNLSGNIIVFTK